MIEWFNQIHTASQLYTWSEVVGYWVFYLSLVYLAFELFYLRFKRKTPGELADVAANAGTSIISFILTGLVGLLHLAGLTALYQHIALIQIPATLASLVLCILLADFIYYWEHRFLHRVGIGWMSHTVHHSSPHFNMSVAYRLGPLNITTLPFYFLLVVIGFHPLVIFAAISFGLIYQTYLHTPLIGKLPRPFERVLNTPSHHRVHHGCNPQYIDKNYGGIFIIWDKLFGTFAEEQEPVTYGITDPINSANPLVVSFHGITRIYKKMRSAPTLKHSLEYLIRHPGWEPEVTPQSDPVKIQATP